MVNGPAWKALIEEEFGDGIMSAIDFDMVMERLPNPKGDGSNCRCPANSCHTNITAPAATSRNMDSRRAEVQFLTSARRSFRRPSEAAPVHF